MTQSNIEFLKEKYEKENRDLKFHEEFIAIPGLKSVSGKFYAKHDIITKNNVSEEFLNLVRRSASLTPKDNFKFPPPCVNMDYGWYPETLIPRSSDKRLIFPLNQCDFVKTEIYIRTMDKKVPQEKFTGIPFRI